MYAHAARTESLRRAFLGFDYRLWLIITLQSLIPTIWLTFRIYLIGELPDSSGIDIASQLMWINLLYEIFQEALIIPLYAVFGTSLKDDREFVNRMRGGLLVVVATYAAFAVFIFVFTEPLVSFMGQNPELVEQTCQYVRLETVAALFSTLVMFFTVIMISRHLDGAMYAILVVQMSLTILTDTFLISSLPCSLSLGVNGIACSNIIVNAVILMAVLVALNRNGLNICSKQRLEFGWMKEWARIGFYSGAESFLRNLVFMFMVVRLVNLVADQGDYWIANNFIWNWLLIPFISLGNVVKKQVAEDRHNIETKTCGYVLFTSVLLVMMLATIPIWPLFIEHVLNSDHFDAVFGICLAMMIPYCTYVFNNIMDSTFIGTGNTKYQLIQSICIDGVYYSFVFILYSLGIFEPTLSTIIAMFGIGMILDLIPASILYRKLLRDNGLKIRWTDTAVDT